MVILISIITKAREGSLELMVILKVLLRQITASPMSI